MKELAAPSSPFLTQAEYSNLRHIFDSGRTLKIINVQSFVDTFHSLLLSSPTSFIGDPGTCRSDSRRAIRQEGDPWSGAS